MVIILLLEYIIALFLLSTTAVSVLEYIQLKEPSIVDKLTAIAFYGIMAYCIVMTLLVQNQNGLS